MDTVRILIQQSRAVKAIAFCSHLRGFVCRKVNTINGVFAPDVLILRGRFYDCPRFEFYP